jgi:hypothetical protein
MEQFLILVPHLLGLRIAKLQLKLRLNDFKFKYYNAYKKFFAWESPKILLIAN